MPALFHPGQRLTTHSGRILFVREWRGEGSYARLYRGELHSAAGAGWDREPETCAVKLAKREVSRAAEFLDREREALRRGPFPGVVELLDWGAAGAPFLLLSWIEGESLRDVVARRRQLPLAHAVRLFRDAAGGVAALHEGGVAHGDLRPENVLVFPDAGGARLTDLGAAVLRSEPRWPDARRDDIHHLGNLLHLMLTGTPAAAGNDRLSGGSGYHPEVVALYGAAISAGTEARTLASRAEQLLERLGLDRVAAGPRAR